MKWRLDGNPVNDRARDLNVGLKGLNSSQVPHTFFSVPFLYKMLDKRTVPSSPANLPLSFFICFQMCWWMGSHVTAMSLLTVKWVTLWPWRCNWPIGARTQWAPWLWLWCPIRTSRTESRTTIWRTRSPSSAPTPSTLTRSVGAGVLYWCHFPTNSKETHLTQLCHILFLPRMLHDVTLWAVLN